LTGKLYRTYDESLEVYQQLQKDTGNPHHLENMEFGRRLTIEHEIDNAERGRVPPPSVLFDQSGNFLIYPTILGIKGFLK